MRIMTFDRPDIEVIKKEFTKKDREVKRSLKSDKKKWMESWKGVYVVWKYNGTPKYSAATTDKVRTFLVKKEEVLKHCYNTLKKK